MLFKSFVYLGRIHTLLKRTQYKLIPNKGRPSSPLNRRFELRNRKKATSALISCILKRKEDTFVISCIPRKARDWGKASAVGTSLRKIFFLWSSLLTSSLPLLAEFQAWHRCLRRAKASLRLSWMVYIRDWIVWLAEKPWAEVESGWKDCK